MKKILSLICIVLLTQSPISSAEITDNYDDWGDIGNIQDSWDSQEVITDDQFEKVIEQKTKHSKEKAEKKFKKKMGEALIKEEPQMNINKLREMAEDYPTLLVPTNIIYKNTQITPGFYRIISAKNKQNQYFINFYQGNNLIGKIPAIETQDDFDAETVNFAKIIYSNNNQKAKLIYGCLEYNLVADIDAN